MERPLKEVAAFVGAQVVGDPDAAVSDVAPVESAGEGDITFAANAAALQLAAIGKATAIIVKAGSEAGLEGRNLIVAGNPHLAFAKAIELLRPAKPRQPAGVNPAAAVRKSARVGKGVSIGPFAVVEDNAVIGDGSAIGAGAYVGPGVEIGAGSVIHPGVAILEGSKLGSRVIIHANSVIGSDGFGYVATESGAYKIPQRGIVRIEDDVEIGACTAIDRATLGETVIERGAKIDNLVQVAHNARIGAGSIIVSQVGISGSTTVGRGVVIGGQAGLKDHVSVGDGAKVAARAGVTEDLAPGGTYAGFPATSHFAWLRVTAAERALPEMRKKIAELEERLKKIEGSKD
jgi:UDP-3-O-[3-hydroxymyristoyl] glucosamine N-acyltransferase